MDEQIQQLADRARAEGLRLTGEGGLLGRLTKLVTEAALAGEMDDHLGYGKHDPVGCLHWSPGRYAHPRLIHRFQLLLSGL
uniref:hypothetical protein n=1 Tax=Saccharopolyspora pogona TaxID=333966 RepID=UPI001682486B|nr:hypothetical protein [Saccharopolyspora pogona]